MNSNERKEFQKIILNHINEVENEIKNLKELCQPIPPDNAIGRLSRMEAIGEKSINEAALNEAEIRLQKLLLAKDRVSKEDYGLCSQCEEEIPTKRLEIMPESTTCVECLESNS